MAPSPLPLLSPLLSFQIEDLQTTTRRQLEQISNYRCDLVSYRERIEETTKTRDLCNEKLIQLEQRCRDLEDRAYRSQHQQQESIIERDDEIGQLKSMIEQMQNDYQNLLDTKICLDREIATYRKLLDSEEERLNIAGRFPSGPSPTINGSSATTPMVIENLVPVNSFVPLPPPRHRLKRPRFEVDDESLVNPNNNGH